MLPVDSFGDLQGNLLIVGLAPGFMVPIKQTGLSRVIMLVIFYMKRFMN